MAFHIKTFIQHLVPQRALSQFAGWVAKLRWRWWRNWVIQDFIRRYGVDLSIAQYENITDYPSFNCFFTRKLKPNARPITQGETDIASPVDGCISQIGIIEGQKLLQAKDFYFTLLALLGGNRSWASTFEQGYFATLYLAPKDYHRVHMPISGYLKETIYLPGKLFSVSQFTTQTVPELFSRNERLVCFFETDFGPMAVILVGAMLVSAIQTVWQKQAYRPNKIETRTFSEAIYLERGAELGHFQMGSTVILLFAKNSIKWQETLGEDSIVKMGELLGTGEKKG